MGFGKKTETVITVKAPEFTILEATIRGTAPFVSNNFGGEAREMMIADMEKGTKEAKASKVRNNKEKPPKDFDLSYRDSMHVATSDETGKTLAQKNQWHGIPCSAFRNSLIRACSVTGVEMTKAKMCVFVMADGFAEDGTPLVRITKGTPHMDSRAVRNANGSIDIRARAMWTAGWEANLRIRYDGSLMTAQTVLNLLTRSGIQVGVGAGRPFSTNSGGQGWGTFAPVAQIVDAAAE